MRAPPFGRCLTGRANRSDGQVLVLFAAGLVAFCGLAAMSIDVGRLTVERRSLQNTADAASLAGAAILMDGGSHAAAVAEAIDYGVRNGYTSADLVVNHPPTSGPLSGDMGAVEVRATHDVEKYFVGVVYSGQWRASARAVSKMVNTQTGFGVITLDTSRCSSLAMNSNAQLKVTGGSIYVNSNCGGSAFSMDSNADASAGSINIVGGFSGAANVHVTPAPLTHQPPAPDPFAAIPVPPVVSSPDRTGGGCSFTHGNVTFNPGFYNCKVTLDSNTTATFNPGNYTFKGGMQLDSNVTVTFGRGIYVMQGEGFQLNSNAIVNGPNGVLIYNTCATTCGTSGTVQMNSNAKLNVKPYGAPYANLVIWQDRNSDKPMQFNSNSLTTAGAIYAKSADIEYNSNATVPMQFVAKNVKMNSLAKIIVDVTGMSTVSTKSISLSE